MDQLKNYFIEAPGEYKEGEVSVFRQSFCVKSLKQAVLYSTALGVYEAELNGKKVGQQLFAPGYTYYPRRLLYQENDVTELLCEGENCLVIYLSQGWYCGRYLCENKTQIYGEKPAISWLLELTEASREKRILTSRNETSMVESPYEYAGEYDGEIYHADCKMELIGVPHPFTGEMPFTLEKTQNEVRLQEEMPVLEVKKQGDVTILDFGQNFAGVIEINPFFLKGEVVTIRHGEILKPDGSLYTANLRRAKATIVYYSGEEERPYRPRFTYMGFRYAELSGVSYRPGLLKAYAIYTNMKRTGFFQCENELVQKLYSNQVWGQKSNYVEVPTDCPQRDERMGYTGDGHVFALTGAYNFDTHSFWRNFLKDLELGQLDNTEGYVCATVPQTGPNGIGFISMLGWGNAVTILPELLYWQFGDKEALLRQYESMKRFVDAEIRKMGRKNLWICPSLGDWLAPGKGMAWQAMHNHPVSNAFIVHDLEVVSRVAESLGKDEDAEKYREQLEKTREAYRKKFISKKGIVAKDYQSAYIMALRFVIPEGEQRRLVLKQFVRNVRKEGMNTGFFATEHLLPLLVEAGETALAYDILLQEECPGWMYQIKRGATTTWEKWDAIRPDGTVNEKHVSSDNMVSFNHYAFGSVGEFYYQYILGIKPLEMGFARVRIKPYTDRRLGRVSGSFLSRAGEIHSEWSYESDGIHFNFTVPVSSEIILPDGRVENVLAGQYHYVVQERS